jgi:hypothetical protein
MGVLLDEFMGIPEAERQYLEVVPPGSGLITALEVVGWVLVPVIQAGRLLYRCSRRLCGVLPMVLPALADNPSKQVTNKICNRPAFLVRPLNQRVRRLGLELNRQTRPTRPHIIRHGIAPKFPGKMRAAAESRNAPLGRAQGREPVGDRVSRGIKNSPVF